MLDALWGRVLTGDKIRAATCQTRQLTNKKQVERNRWTVVWWYLASGSAIDAVIRGSGQTRAVAVAVDVRSLLGLSRQSLPTVINANAITSSERQRAADLSPLPASLLAPSRPLACPAGHARGRQDSDVAGRRAGRTGRRLGASTRPASVPCHASPRRHAYVRGNWFYYHRHGG